MNSGQVEDDAAVPMPRALILIVLHRSAPRGLEESVVVSGSLVHGVRGRRKEKFRHPAWHPAEHGGKLLLSSQPSLSRSRSLVPDVTSCCTLVFLSRFMRRPAIHTCAASVRGV